MSINTSFRCATDLSSGKLPSDAFSLFRVPWFLLWIMIPVVNNVQVRESRCHYERCIFRVSCRTSLIRILHYTFRAMSRRSSDWTYGHFNIGVTTLFNPIKITSRTWLSTAAKTKNTIGPSSNFVEYFSFSALNFTLAFTPDVTQIQWLNPRLFQLLV